VHDWSRRTEAEWLAAYEELFAAREANWVSRHLIEVVCGALLFLVLFLTFQDRMFIAVGSGQRAVRWSRFFGGTVNRVYGEGMHFFAPWDEVSLYDVRVQEISAPVRVLTAGGLDMIVDVSIRYRPRIEQLSDLHVRIGPDYAKKLVLQEIASTLQRILGDQSYTSLTEAATYTTALRNTVQHARAQLTGEAVEIEDVVIRQITLPPELSKAIHEKLREQQMAELYRYRVDQAKREAERKSIEAEGIRRFQQIVSTNLDERFLRLRGIEATLELAKSDNAKVVFIGRGGDGLPILFDPTTAAAKTGGKP
jgi:regulator of protease activity HflC (stomatin/prohibitin superfamily)